MDPFKQIIHERLIPVLHDQDPNKVGPGLIDTLVENLATELQQQGVELADDRLDRLRADVFQELIGFGPLHSLMHDPEVTEILVNAPDLVFAERRGIKTPVAAHFRDIEHVRYVVQRILHMNPGRRVDEVQPFVDLWLEDGSRVNVIIPPVVVGCPHLTIRKYSRWFRGIDDFVRNGTLDNRMARFLQACAHNRRSILFSGATGSGKTTLLEVVSASIPDTERLVVIEDTLELRLHQPDVVRLLSRMPNLEGKGEVTIGDLFHNTLRMRPDRIILGELRGRESLDYLQAITSGHRGSLAVIHAASPEEAVLRLENLATSAGLNIPLASVRSQIAHGLEIIVQVERAADGARRVTRISEVVGLQDNGRVDLRDLFVWKADRRAAGGKVTGHFEATGNLPTFLQALALDGQLLPASDFAPPNR
jgi:pilus assembly protein CpaF